MMIMGECVTGWNWESQRAELSQEHPERNYFGSELQYVPCFLLTPSTQPYMEPRSVDSSLLPILKVFFLFLLLLLVTWFLGCSLWDERSSHFHLFFSPAQKFSLAAFYTFQLLRRNLGLLPASVIVFFSLFFHPLPSASPGLLASQMLLGSDVFVWIWLFLWPSNSGTSPVGLPSYFSFVGGNAAQRGPE